MASGSRRERQTVAELIKEKFGTKPASDTQDPNDSDWERKNDANRQRPRKS